MVVALVLTGLLLLYLGILLLVLRFTLFPMRTPIFFSPGIMGLKQTDITFKTFDGLTLSGWWLDGEDRQSRKVAILLHGYMMNRSELAPLAVPLGKAGYDCLVIDFPGHGRSPRRKTGIGYTEQGDVRAAIDYVLGKKPDAEIVLIGSSMGAVAAAFAAPGAPKQVKALILDGAYARMSDAITGFLEFIAGKPARRFLSPLKFLGRPFMGLNPFQIRVPDALAKLDIPVLLLHGDSDVLAPRADAEANLAALGKHGKLAWLPESNHAEGRWIHPEQYHRELFAFLDRVFAEAPSKNEH